MERRTFLKSSLAMGLSAGASNSFSQAYDTAAWAKTWDAALAVLAGNVKIMPKYDRPILQEGSVYRGPWMECGPHESLAYAELANFVAPVEQGPSPLEIAIQYAQGILRQPTRRRPISRECDAVGNELDDDPNGRSDRSDRLGYGTGQQLPLEGRCEWVSRK